MAFGNKKWLALLKEKLEQGSEVVQTARGPVEFTRQGVSPYLLFFHGTPGGYDQNITADSFAEAGFGTITPSRPGFLRTPLETGRTFEEQADAFAALLDELKVDQVVATRYFGRGPLCHSFCRRSSGQNPRASFELRGHRELSTGDFLLGPQTSPLSDSFAAAAPDV